MNREPENQKVFIHDLGLENGERRTQTADTTIFSRVLLLLSLVVLQGFRLVPAWSGGVRVFSHFAVVSRMKGPTARSVGLFVALDYADPNTPA